MQHTIQNEINTIIGLGNPGPRFAFTPHNAGFMVVDALADKYGGVWKEKDAMALCSITSGDKKITLIKPLTFMNLSGSIFSTLQKKGITPDHILVVHDELEKPFGAITFRFGGSHRGHNGLRSIIQAIGPDFTRLRFGIGRPERKEDVNDYVISRFTQDPDAVAQQIDKAVGMIEQKIMNKELT
jgi:PTH1 family peptidyl-tRNA hydrolase